MKLSRQTVNNISLESFNVYPKTLIEYRRLKEVISLVNDQRYEIDLALLSGFKSARRLSRLFDKYFSLSYKEVLTAAAIQDFDINELVSLLDAFMPRKMNCT
jgi:transcriptional regulator GlxA family with amidase domain